ncbi:MAG TPA: hypothetical protein VES66_05730 [Terriglobales bacterium]|nr:hypothetical protein [Terriglobales bacterium]
MKSTVARKYREGYEAVEAVAERDAWDIAVRIWDGKATNRTSSGKVLMMEKKESVAKPILKTTPPKRKVIGKRAIR